MRKASDPHIEAMIISATISDPFARYVFMDKLSPDDFSPEFSYAKIWATIVAEENETEFWNVPSLRERLAAFPAELKCLQNCIDAHVTGLDADHYVKDLKEMRRQREFEKLISSSLLGNFSSIDDAIKHLYRGIDSIERNNFQEEDYSIATLSKRLKENYASDKIDFIPTGYPILDENICGFPLGGVTIIAARTSTGKTTFMCNFILNLMAAKQEVAVFSLEVSRDKFYKKLLMTLAGVSLYKFNKKNLSPSEQLCIEQAQGQLDKYGILPIEDADHDLRSLCQKIRYLAKRYHRKVVFIDYFGRIPPTGEHKDLYQSYGEISRQLNNLAKELDIAIICLAQLNRDASFNPQLPPDVSKISESDKIGQDADLILMLHRPYVGGRAVENQTNLIVSKYREEGNMPTIAYRHERGKYTELNVVNDKGHYKTPKDDSKPVDIRSAQYKDD